MKQFYETYKDAEFVTLLVTQSVNNAPKYAIVPECHEFLYINRPYQKPQLKQIYTPHMYKYTLSFIIPSNFQGSSWGQPHLTRAKKFP